MKKLIVLTAGSLLVGSLGFVGAQGAQSGSDTQSQTQAPLHMQNFRGFGHGFGEGDDFGYGFGGSPFGRHLALGTTVKLTFYNTDPGASGSTAKPTQTLTFTYGQDSEAAFRAELSLRRGRTRAI